VTGAGTDRTKSLIAGGPAIILVRPQLAVNIGMCARAMVNFGLNDLRLVSPREGWPRNDARREVAYSAAAGAAHLLDAAKVFDTLEDAVADLHFVYATTARERGQMKAVLPPADAMAETANASAAGQKRGILFGPERTGLNNREISLADAIITFPVNPAYASLNLAQAVLLCGYEWFKAAHAEPAPAPMRARSGPATREMVVAFFDFLDSKLEERGFFRPVGKKPIMQRNLRNIFHRVGLTEQDVRTLWGAIVRLVEGPRVTVQTRKRRRIEKS